MSIDAGPDELKVFNQIVSNLSPLSSAAKRKVLETVIKFLEVDMPPFGAQIAERKPGVVSASDAVPRPFSDKEDISVKEFLMQKEPRTDVERVACLAYFLTHYRNTPEFSTVD